MRRRRQVPVAAQVLVLSHLRGIELDQAAARDLDTLDQPPRRRILAVLHNRVARWCLSLTFQQVQKSGILILLHNCYTVTSSQSAVDGVHDW